MSEEHKKILDMVGSGQISPEQGAALLAAVAGPDEEQKVQAEEQPTAPSEGTAMVSEHVRRPALWVYPLGAGLALLLIGTTIVATMHREQRVNIWTWLCGWGPLLAGLTVVTLSAWARTAHWIHLRVRDHGNHVALSFPLPLGLAAAAIQVARPFVPQLRDTAVDEAILALREGLEGNEDITIDVQDDDEGESVQIDFGGKQ